MFGFGWGEMVVIGIVALIAIGPKELPTVLRTIGFWMGKVRRMANEFQGQFQEALREAELTDLQKHAEDLASDLNKFGTDTQQEMEKSFDFNDPLKEVPATPAMPAADVAIDVPLPELPPPVSEKDFAPPEPPAAEAAKEPPAELPQESSQESSQESHDGPTKQAGA